MVENKIKIAQTSYCPNSAELASDDKWKIKENLPNDTLQYPYQTRFNVRILWIIM